MNKNQWFIANKKNKFHPVALRPLGLMIFLLVFVSVPLLYNVTAAKQFQVLGYATNVTASELYSLSNQERTNVGLSPLALNAALNSAALAKANDMMAKDYWAHVAPDGTTPWSFITASGYQYTAAGENLAKNFNISSGVVAGWMASPLHKANILNTSYKDVGYAVVDGILLGEETTLVVAMYGAKDEPVVAPPAGPTQTSQQPTAPANVAPTTKYPETVTEPVAVALTPEVTETVPKTQVQDIKTNTPTTTTTAAEKIPEKGTGSVEGVSIYAPLKTYNSLNWGQKVSIVLMSTLILLFIMKHTLIWREKKRGFRHIWLRAHPLAQAALLTTVMIITIISGAGTVL